MQHTTVGSAVTSACTWKRDLVWSVILCWLLTNEKSQLMHNTRKLRRKAPGIETLKKASASSPNIECKSKKQKCS